MWGIINFDGDFLFQDEDQRTCEIELESRELLDAEIVELDEDERC